MPFARPQNFFYESQWGLKQINAEKAWQLLNQLCLTRTGVDCGQY
jgi:hypothetical protein